MQRTKLAAKEVMRMKPALNFQKIKTKYWPRAVEFGIELYTSDMLERTTHETQTFPRHAQLGAPE